MKIEKKLNYMQEDLNKLVKGGWGPHKRATNYVKKNTGVGGGNCSKMELSPPSKPAKSHKEHIEELRYFIKKSTKENSNQDKFSFYPERQNHHQQVGKQNKREVKKKRKEDGNDEFEFELEEDAGDQGVNLEPYHNPYHKEESKVKQNEENIYNKIKTENMEEYMNENEMKELMEKEKEILDWDKKNSNELIFGSLLSDVQGEVEEVRAHMSEEKQQKRQK